MADSPTQKYSQSSELSEVDCWSLFQKRHILIFSLICFWAVLAIPDFRVVAQWGLDFYGHRDFAHYYVSALLLTLGKNPYTESFLPYYEQFGAWVSPTHSGTNPPALILLTLPLAWLPPRTAYYLWASLLLVCVVFSVQSAMNVLQLRFSKLQKVMITAFVIMSSPFLLGIGHGQVQPLLLLLSLCAVGNLLREDSRSQRVGCILLGVVTSIKFFTLPFVYLAFRAQKVRGVASFCMGFLLLNIPFLLCAPQIVSTFVTEALPRVASASYELVYNTSLTGAIIYTAIKLDPFGFWQNFAIEYAPKISYLVLLLVLSLDYFRTKNKTSIFFSANNCFLCSVLLMPVSWPHYLLFLLLPLFSVLRLANQQPRKTVLLFFALALLINISRGLLVQLPLLVALSICWVPVLVLVLLCLWNFRLYETGQL